MPLCCPTCASWTVPIDGTQTVKARCDGLDREFVYGTCRVCESFVMHAPTPAAVARMNALIRAAEHAEAVAGHG